jgi:hypothetical protein
MELLGLKGEFCLLFYTAFIVRTILEGRVSDFKANTIAWFVFFFPFTIIP